jgi:hypothetical protein
MTHPGDIRVRVRTRQRPLRAMRDLLHELVGELRPVLADVAVASHERVVTVEGEYAAVATVLGRRRGCPYEHTIGVVFGDESYTRVDAATPDAARFAEARLGVRSVVEDTRLGLGRSRWRRFPYAAPAGWRPLPRGLVTRWCSPDFPRRRGLITVYPATPAEGQRPTLDETLADLGATPAGRLVRSHDLLLACGRAASVWGLAGADGVQLVAVIADDTHVYRMVLDTCAELLAEHERAFYALVRSVELLPQRARRGAQAAAAVELSHWAA